MTTPILSTISGNLRIFHTNPQNAIPFVVKIEFNGKDLAQLINQYTSTNFVGTRKYGSYKERVALDPNFKTFACQFFNEIHRLQTNYPALSVSCADYFFNHVCRFYWDLILNKGSKNLACAFLEEICVMVNKWENKSRRIHKGTPYYFLTYCYREMGDIDSAFASAFKAIQEDKLSVDPILGVGAYKNSPAFKYASIIDDKGNYLYNVVMDIRGLLDNYIRKFQNHIQYQFSLTDMDSKFLQGNTGLEDVAHFFVYTLESINKYLNQLPMLPKNDFYKMKNSRDIFNLCLIIDKILQFKYQISFNRYVHPKRSMYISDSIVLFFEDKGWISRLTNSQKRNPKSNVNIQPTLPKGTTSRINKILSSTSPLTFNGSPVNDEMRFMLLAYVLRNIGAHEIKKLNIFVSRYKKIVENLLFSVFISVNNL